MRNKIYLIAVLIFDVFQALAARQAFNQNSKLFLILAILSLILSGYFFIQLLKNKVGIIANAIWVALGTMNVTLASYLVFGEKITWFQGLGMTLIVTGIILIEAYSEEETQLKKIDEGKEINPLIKNISKRESQIDYLTQIKMGLENTRRKSAQLFEAYF